MKAPFFSATILAMKNLTVTGLMLYILVLCGCATRPPAPQLAETDGLNQWESTVQVLDRNTKKSQSLTVDFVAFGRDQLRMEVTGTFSTPVALAVLNREKLTYILPRQKRYYQGAAKPDSLRQLLRFEIEPEQIFRMLYDEPFAGGAWICERTVAGLTESCENANSRVRIAWLRRDGAKRDVKISGPRFEVNLNMERIATKVQNGPRLFTVKIPAGYSQDL